MPGDPNNSPAPSAGRAWLLVVTLAGVAAALGALCFPAGTPVGGNFPNVFSVGIRAAQGGTVGIGFEFGAGLDGSLCSYAALPPSRDDTRLSLALPAGTITALRLFLPDSHPRASATDARILDARGRLLWQFADGDLRSDGRIALRSNLHLPTDPRRPDRTPARERWAAILLALAGGAILLLLGRRRDSRIVPPWLCRAAIGFAAAAVLFSRRPGFFVEPQFWCEDGTVYFLAGTDGLRSLWETQANYLVLVPRAIAAASALAPVWYAPILYAAASVAVCLMAAVKAASPRVGLPLPALAGLAVVLVPNMDEITANVTNVQWFGAVILILVCVSTPPRTLSEAVRDTLAILLFGLTGPYVIFVIPLLLWRALRTRVPAAWMLLGLGIALAVLQYWAFRLSRPAPFPGELPPLIPMMAAAGYRTGGQLFSLMPAPLLANPVPWGLAGLALYGLVWCLFPLRAALGEIRPALGWAALAIIAGGLLRYVHLVDQFFEQGFITRYFHFPLLCATWLLLAGLAMSGPRRWLAVLGLAAAVACNAPGYRMAPYIDLHWPHYASAIERGQPVRVPVNPPFWSFESRGRR